MTADAAAGALPVRYEVLPFPAAWSEASAARDPLTVTVTCSPRHGLDHTIDLACRLRGLNHRVVPHVAARMVEGPKHLTLVLARLEAAGIGDVFLVGGDATAPLGPYTSGLELIGELRGHEHAPRRIGVPAYPEGHPLVDPDTLAEALRAKAAHADYMTSQLCFDPAAVLDWLAHVRADGVELPLLAGVPGAVDSRRLLEISLRVGVGASVRFARKQRGLRRLFGSAEHAAERLITALSAPEARRLGVAGLHLFTFNRLVATEGLVRRIADRAAGAATLRQESQIR